MYHISVIISVIESREASTYIICLVGRPELNIIRSIHCHLILKRGLLRLFSLFSHSSTFSVAEQGGGGEGAASLNRNISHNFRRNNIRLLFIKYPLSQYVLNCVSMADQRRGEGGARQFPSQMYFYYTNRGAHIYMAPAAIPPAPPLYLFLFFSFYYYYYFIFKNNYIYLQLATIQ